MFEQAAHAFSEVFAPEFFLFLCGLLAIGYEWHRETAQTLGGLGMRVCVLGLGWAVAFAVYEGAPRALGPVPGGTDVTGSVGLGVGLLVVREVWRRREWGRLVSEYAASLVAVTVPHLLITPVWDLSSHVLYAATPVGVLLSADERFAPLVAVPVLMVFGRPLAGAHTWAQSVAGLLLAVAVLCARRRRLAAAATAADAVDRAPR